MAEMNEGINVLKCTMKDFTDTLKGKLGLMALSDDELKSLGLGLEMVRFPLLVLGVGGIGKTATIRSLVHEVNESLAEDKQFGFKKIQLGQLVVGDLTGIPVVLPDGTVKRVQCDDLPQNDPSKPDYKEYGVLFFDELTTVDEAQMQPALGLADNSRSIGAYKLPEHWLVVAAGNGPDCSNFIRLDDVMMSRFEVFDVVSDYKRDWRGWAQQNNIAEEIISFLNFDDSEYVNVVTTDMDEQGKGNQYANPRTWELLSNSIQIYKTVNKKDFWPQEEVCNRASRIIGTKTARKFAAFCAFREKVDYDPQKILAGTEKDPDMDMAKEVFHILMERCVKQLQKDLEGKGKEPSVTGGDWVYPKECYEKVANFIDWLMKFEATNLENCLQAFILLRTSSTDAVQITTSMVFEPYCPSFNDFLARNSEYLIENEIS